jgi:hypothetical protein
VPGWWRWLVRRSILGAAILFALGVGSAHASQLVDRNASGVKLAVNAKGEALLTYTAGGKLKHVLAWGAVNALAPTRTREQVALELDYGGGDWKTFGTACGAYNGPALPWLVAACRAPDGSYWALQAWQKGLPNYGVTPTPEQAAWELHVAHWTGELPVLTIKTDWAFRRFDHLYGSFTYDSEGVYGFRSTRTGVPLDTYGRNLYVDTYGSAYGSGWKRENSFLTHRSGGTFCYGFYPHAGHPPGRGTKYRATIMGPGVTPDIMWQGTAPGQYDQAEDQTANDEQRALADSSCKIN